MSNSLSKLEAFDQSPLDVPGRPLTEPIAPPDKDKKGDRQSQTKPKPTKKREVPRAPAYTPSVPLPERTLEKVEPAPPSPAGPEPPPTALRQAPETVPQEPTEPAPLPSRAPKTEQPASPPPLPKPPRPEIPVPETPAAKPPERLPPRLRKKMEQEQRAAPAPESAPVPRPPVPKPPPQEPPAVTTAELPPLPAGNGKLRPPQPDVLRARKAAKPRPTRAIPEVRPSGAQPVAPPPTPADSPPAEPPPMEATPMAPADGAGGAPPIEPPARPLPEPGGETTPPPLAPREERGRGELAALKDTTDLSNCLMPLLEALHWRGDPRHVAEAVPHFLNAIDVTAFRNIMATLHYQSRKIEIKLSRIDPRLYPCLFLPDAGLPNLT